MFNTRKIAGVVGLLLLFAFGFYIWKNHQKKATLWKTAPIEFGSIQTSVTATGILQALVTVQIGTQVSGTISALYVDFNSKVRKGQVLARLDTTLLMANLTEVQSGLARVLAQDKKASEDLKRVRALFERSLVSQAELDQANAEAQMAKAGYSSSKAQVDKARINLGFATITSPIDGIVISRAVDLGQTVASSFSTPTLFTIAGDLREMQVLASVDEADIGKIRKGQQAQFRVDAYPDTIFAGVVDQIRLQPKSEQNVVTYDVLIRARNPQLQLMPGMTANLTIVLEKKHNVMIVPAAALRFRPPTNVGDPKTKASQIFLFSKGNIQPLEVKTGLSDGIKTEIEGDVRLGMEVVLGIDLPKKNTTSAKPFGMDNKPRR